MKFFYLRIGKTLSVFGKVGAGSSAGLRARSEGLIRKFFLPLPFAPCYLPFNSCPSLSILVINKKFNFI
jgi:hypothetical protein